MNYSEFIKKLIESYRCKDSGDFWNNEVNRASKLLQVQFDSNLHPHFFSGNIRKSKFVAITMNPKKRKDGSSITDSQTLEQLSFSEFWIEQQNRFRTFTKRSEVYDKLEKLITNLNPIMMQKNDLDLSNHYYKSLSLSGTAVDLFPFYSDNFKINYSKLSTEASLLLIEYFFRILIFLLNNIDNGKIILVLVSSLTSALLDSSNNLVNSRLPFNIKGFKRVVVNKKGHKSKIYELEDPNSGKTIFATTNWGRISDSAIKKYAEFILNHCK